MAISSDAHRAGMRAAAPGKYEYEVEAAIEEVYLRNGAMSWGYPSIVGSGPNATILHYQKSLRKMEPGDLLLVDAAGNYRGSPATSPARIRSSGTFSREQRDIYEIVFAAQQAGEKAAKAGGEAARHPEGMRRGPSRGTGAAGPRHRADRHAVQDLGDARRVALDRHGRARRVASRGRSAPGMAFTIEPGIYIREAALDDLPKTPANAAFIDEGPRRVVQKYKNIGVRIEDSYLLTAAGSNGCRRACRERLTKSNSSSRLAGRTLRR